MMIIEYAVPSLALNYPYKKYQIIYESVHIYWCTCMRNNVHIQVYVEVDQFLNSQHA